MLTLYHGLGEGGVFLFIYFCNLFLRGGGGCVEDVGVWGVVFFSGCAVG